MEAYEEIQSRQMQLMLEPARERLKQYTIEELCRKGKLDYDAETAEFPVQSMGQIIHVHYPDFVIRENLEMWHHLTILQYMDTADGSPLSGTEIGLTQMRGGLSRGRGFDKDISLMFDRYFQNVTPDQFRDACIALGGEIKKSKADVSAVIWYAPMFPVTVNFWEGDDEFPPSGKTLVDANAEHYLTIEAAGGACSSVVQALKNTLNPENANNTASFSGV